MSDPSNTYTPAERASAAAITAVWADAERVRRITDELAEAREDLDASLALAVDVGVPVTRLAEEAGLSRESVYQALRRQEERRASAD